MTGTRTLTIFAQPAQEFGSPSKNGLGHKETLTVHPVSRQQVSAVFIPEKKAGRWNGEVSLGVTVASDNIVDDDTEALRQNQLQISNGAMSHGWETDE